MKIDPAEMARGELFVQAIHHACGTLGPSDLTSDEAYQMADVTAQAAIAWVRRRNIQKARAK